MLVLFRSGYFISPVPTIYGELSLISHVWKSPMGDQQLLYGMATSKECQRREKQKGKSVPLQALKCPRGFQEVKAPRFRDTGTGWW